MVFDPPSLGLPLGGEGRGRGGGLNDPDPWTYQTTEENLD